MTETRSTVRAGTSHRPHRPEGSTVARRTVTRYTLERTLPDGTVKVWPDPMSLREAGVTVARCLHDNGAATKSQAQAVSPLVERTPVGEYVDAYGYRFRFLPA